MLVRKVNKHCVTLVLIKGLKFILIIIIVWHKVIAEVYLVGTRFTTLANLSMRLVY